ncbi:hypothetical protein B0G80_4924 [Paraburkholderia sp. BL6669N2]|uniref:hypothetical protein n=1 Tax=Paraburkholderia sp. BL6669N2 TaxID=1938807 RepID=UPI000E25C5DE|nr:hypothetical protein [Paraburkholderia sp. BL6669N2]REG48662.1 hypothetical protein B0G80_4924 [Paraburkholderia sp. BL6669N2]
MFRKQIVFLSVAATGLFMSAQPAYSSGECSASTLNGTYSFSAHGELLGILDTSVSPPALSPLTTPIVIDGVALQKFDGAGSFTRTDFLNTNGSPRGGQTAFNPNQHGTYAVNPDCTGTMHIVYDSGAILDLQMVLANDARTIKAIISAETVPSFPTSSGKTCDASTGGCSIGVQVSLDGQRTHDRDRDRDH